VPALNLYDRNWPVWTYQQQLPPAKFVHNHLDRRGNAIESTVSGGCIVSGEVNRSLLFSGVPRPFLFAGKSVGRAARYDDRSESPPEPLRRR
jgi:hypothetical protein